MFGNIDKKFEKIGFLKVEENKYGARYERKKMKNITIHKCWQFFIKQMADILCSLMTRICLIAKISEILALV